MNYKVDTIPLFEKQVKRLSKKYPSIRNDLISLVQQLEKNPELGIPLGNNFYKIRMQIVSKGKGKSGGARLITFVKVIANTVFLSTIYDKGEKETITNYELKQIFKEIP